MRDDSMRGEAKQEAASPGSRQGAYAGSTSTGRAMPASSPLPGSTASASGTRQASRVPQLQAGPSSGPHDSHDKRYGTMRVSQSRQAGLYSGGLSGMPTPSRSGPASSPAGPNTPGQYALASPRGTHTGGSRAQIDPFAETLPITVTVSNSSSVAPPASRSDRMRASAPSPAGGVRATQPPASRPGVPRLATVSSSGEALFPGTGLITATDDAGVLFRQMDASPLLYHDMQEPSSPMATAMRGPPPAGMRGALSWGVGPNAFESDGRPGTRGGGTAYDLEGRPLTRSGARPASRMQSAQVGTGGAASTFPGPGAGDRDRGGVPGPAGPGPGSSNQGMGSGAAPSLGQPGRRVGSGGPVPGSSPALQQRLSGTQSHGGMRLDAPPPGSVPGATDRGRPQSLQPHGSRAQPQGLQGSSIGAAAGPSSPNPGGRGVPGAGRGAPEAARLSGANGSGAGHAAAGDEQDIDALLDAMSDGEGDEGSGSGSLDDLHKYLNTLDQDKPSVKAAAPPQARHSSKQVAGPAAEHQHHHHHQQPAAARGVPQHLAHLNHKAVRASLKVLDVLVAQAVRTAEVNALIAAAERNAMLDEVQFGVQLGGDEWQSTVRAAVAPPTNNGDEFGGLLSAVQRAGSKMPDPEKFAAQQAAEAEADARVMQGLALPRDEFYHLTSPVVSPGGGRNGGGGAGGRSGPGRGAGMRASVGASLSSLPPDVLGANGGMGRYAAHRL